jgi:PAP2 superfamily
LLKSYHWLHCLQRVSLGGKGNFVTFSRPNPPLSRTRCFGKFYGILATLAVALGCVPPAQADAVSDWYAATQEVRETFPPATDPIAEQASTLVALAMYDAIVSIEGGYRPYLGHLPARPGASSSIAAHAAAHAMLVKLFPAHRARFDRLYDTVIKSAAEGAGRSSGIVIGEAAAARLLAHRAPLAVDIKTSYRPSAKPGQFVPPQLPAREWLARFKPFVLDDLEHFQAAGPPPLATAAYARDYAEVEAIGARDSQLRTEEQTKTAKFWNSTGLAQLPPQFFDRPGRALAANARLWAIYATAEFDAAIVLVREKYRYNFWRPVTALRNGDNDLNPSTRRSEYWEPLLATPAHPDYPCGHCMIAATALEVMSAEFGPSSSTEFVIASGPDKRRYSNFDDLGAEISNSRIWGGVHFRTGAIDGARLGRRVAQAIAKRAFERTDK